MREMLLPRSQIKQATITFTDPHHQGLIKTRGSTIDLAFFENIQQGHHLAMGSFNGNYNPFRLCSDAQDFQSVSGQQLRVPLFHIMDPQPICTLKPNEARVRSEAASLSP